MEVRQRVLDPGDIGAGYPSAMGGGAYSLQRISGHEMAIWPWATSITDRGNEHVNWNENLVLRQLDDFSLCLLTC